MINPAAAAELPDGKILRKVICTELRRFIFLDETAEMEEGRRLADEGRRAAAAASNNSNNNRGLLNSKPH